MTLAKNMVYEDMPFKVNTKRSAKKVKENELNNLSSFSIAWFLIKRHKVGLLTIGNIILVLNWAFPAWTELVKSLI